MFAYMQTFNSSKSNGNSDDSILQRVKQIAEEVETSDMLSKDSLYSALMEFFTDNQDLETALAMKDKISTAFRLDSFKVLDLAALLVKNGKINAAINLIEEFKNRQLKESKTNFRDKRNDFSNYRNKSINRLLNALIDKKVDTNIVRKVFETCVEINLNRVNKTIAGPLIRMHLINSDFESALKEFVSVANTYRTLPWSLELMRIFIENDDKKSLSVVVDKSLQVFGPNSTYLDLVAAYVYSGANDLAMAEMAKVTHLHQNRVELLCDKFVRDGKLDRLDSFVHLCHSKPGVDNQMLIKLLSTAYRNAGLPDKADQVESHLTSGRLVSGSN